MTHALRVIILGGGLVLLLAACGDEAPTAELDGTPTDPAVGGDAAEAEDTTEGEDAAAAVVTVGSTGLGEVLVDGDGMTLYMFDPDEQGEPTCYDDCAGAWPPLLSDGDPQADGGIDAALLGTVARTDGTVQVTYDGWPLYRWAGDAASGDTQGQGVNDVWWALSPEGSPLRDDQGEPADDGY